MLRSFLIALQFLTRFPLPAFGRPEDRDVGRSLLFYPLIGLLIGAMLVALDGVAAGASEALRAALLLAAWVVATRLAILVLMGKSGVLSLVAAAAMFLLLRAMMTRRINGTTGDTVGAMVELTETAVLMVIATQAVCRKA